MARWVEAGVHAFVGAPVLGGLAVTLAASFGYLPALGGETIHLGAWARLLAEPGLTATLALTTGVGLAATAVSLALSFALLAELTARPGRLATALAPLLASPHSALAIGLAFLIAPSGWIFRLLSPWATGLSAPPDLAIVGDPCGLSFTLGLVIKETPFLVAFGLAALRQFPAQAQLRAARSLGYASRAAWRLVVAPQLYARMRLPVYAVLAYSLSAIDMALVLAPSHPAPLSVLALRWLLSPDLSDLYPGEAAATLQLGIVLAALLVWRFGEIAAAYRLRRRAEAGARHGADVVVATGAVLGAAVFAAGFAALLCLGLWAFAWRWTFPHSLPESWSFAQAYLRFGRLAEPLAMTLVVALTATLAALALAVAWLESEDRRGRRAQPLPVFLPLLLPQIAFLFGAQTLFAALRLDGTLFAVVWAHLLFVFPYVWLALADSWRALDTRYARAAAALGVGRTATLARVKLPILLGPLALAFAVGFAVSVAQYLATVFPGGGRVTTLTTEALALAAGGDRRLAAVAGLSQAVLPLAVYLAALAAPRVVYARREGLRAP